jgi:oligopeptide/dipeptide ABC transporter ATP-binding protein
MNNTSILSVKGLRKYYPMSVGNWLTGRRVMVKALEFLDLEVLPGETFGIVGESGCGKSTLGRCILRLEEPDQGQVIFNGVDVGRCEPKQLRALRQQMQIIFQDPYSSLDPRQLVGRIISEPLRIHRVMDKKYQNERLADLMKMVGLLPEHLDRYPHEFSGGQRQRICIARALALNPKLVIADEAVSALDVSIQAQTLNLLVDLQNQLSLTYLFISHDLSVVRHICDRLAVMYLGRIVEQTAKDELYANPLHPYTQALLSSVPVVNPRHKKRQIILEGDVPSPLNPPPGCVFHPRCPRSDDRCNHEPPELREIELGHLAACHYPGPDARPKKIRPG